MVPEVVIRGYAERDRAPVVRLLSRCLPYDRLDDAVFADRILRDLDFEPELNLVATADEQVVGFVAGAPANAHLQCPAGVKLFAVAPEWRQRRVATRLFDELEAQLRATGAGQAVAMAAGNNRLTQGLDVRYTAALCFLAARGYERTGVTQDMVVDLARTDLETATAEAAAARASIRFRRATAADRDWLHEGVARELAYPAPGSHLGRRWAYLATLGLDRPPATVQVAEETASGAFLGFGATHVRGGGCSVRWAWRRGSGDAVLARCCSSGACVTCVPTVSSRAKSTASVPSRSMRRRCRLRSAGCFTSLPSGYSAGPLGAVRGATPHPPAAGHPLSTMVERGCPAAG